MPITREDIGMPTAPMSVPSSIDDYKAALWRAEVEIQRRSSEAMSLRAQVKKLEYDLAKARSQLSTAMGYGNDSGIPPWVKP